MQLMTTSFVLGLIAFAAAAPAHAQSAGTYTGTSANGDSVSFTVTASSSGALSVTSATIFFSAPCAGTKLVLNEGEGFGLSAPVTKHHAAATASYPGFWTNFALTFDTAGTAATGTVVTVAPQLAPGTGQPKKVYLCTSPKQKLSVTLQASVAGMATMAASQTYEYDRLGRIVGTVSH